MPQRDLQNRHKVISHKLRLTKSIKLGPCQVGGSDAPKSIQEDVFDSTPFHLATIDKSGYFSSWNKASEVIFGYTRQEAIGKLRPANLCADRFEAGEVINKTLKNGEFNGQVNFLKKNGETFPAFLNVRSLRNEDGSLKGFLCSSVGPAPKQDEKTGAEESMEDAIRLSENTFRAIFDNTGNAALIVNGDGSILHANAQFVNMSGYSLENIVKSKKWFDFFEENEVDTLKKYHRLRRVNPYSAPRNFEVNFVTKEGEIRNVFATVAMIPGTDKSVASLLDITSRKAVENELKASKKLFDDIVYGSPVATYVIDSEHKVVYWNKAMEHLTGLDSSQIIGTDNHWKAYYSKPTRQITDMIIDGMDIDEILAEADRYRDTIFEDINLKTGIVCSAYLEDFPGGKSKWLRFKIKPLYDSDNNIIGAIETAEDITASRELQKDLEIRMREFQVLYKVSAHKRMVYKLGSVLESINDDLVLACEVSESARSRIFFDGKEYSNLGKEEVFVNKIEQTIEINNEVRGKIEIGYVEQIADRHASSMEHEKKLIQIVSEIISKHVQSREFFERYQKLVTKSVSGIFIMQNGQFQYVNPKFVRMFKYRNENEILGLNYNELIPGCPEKLLKNDKIGNAHCDMKIRRKDGQEIYVEVFTQLIDYYGKKAILGTIQDITKIKEAQLRQNNFNEELKVKIADRTKDLQVANKRLLSLNELKDEFIAVTSHELRSPLTSARGYLSFLTSDQLINEVSKEARQYIVKVQENVETLNNLISNILDVNRLEMGRFELHVTPVNIVELLKQIISSLSFQANEKNIPIQFINKMKSENLTLDVDNVRFRQVIRNIIDNAIKFSPRGKPILVELETKGIGVQISVIDSGMGIRKSEIFDIFDKFKQGSNSQTFFRGGAGLGLFIAKRIMEMHGGMIWAESELRKGTTFRIQLPMTGFAGEPQSQINN